jgi:hypothetical protein
MGNESMARTNKQIVEDANALAAEFYASAGYVAKKGFRFDLSCHPQELLMWRMACLAYERIQGTEVEQALAELEDE